MFRIIAIGSIVIDLWRDIPSQNLVNIFKAYDTFLQLNATDWQKNISCLVNNNDLTTIMRMFLHTRIVHLTPHLTIIRRYRCAIKVISANITQSSF